MCAGYPIKNKLRLYRRAKGLKQYEIAYALETSQEQVSRWERGECMPNLEHALRLSAVLNRLVNDMFFEVFDEERDIAIHGMKDLDDVKQQS